MTDRGVDLLSGDAAPPPTTTADASVGVPQATADNGDTKTPATGGPSVDLLGFGDPPAPTSDFDVFASPPPSTSDPFMSSPPPQKDEDAAAPSEVAQPTENGAATTPLDSINEISDPNKVNNDTTATAQIVNGKNSSNNKGDAPSPTNNQSSTTTNEDATATESKNSSEEVASKDLNLEINDYTQPPPADTPPNDRPGEDKTASAGEPLLVTQAAVAETTQSPSSSATAQATPDSSTNKPQPYKTSDNENEQLRNELEETKAELDRVLGEQAKRMEDDGALLMELQSKLQEHMSARAEAENKARLAEQSIESLTQTNNKQAAELEKYHEIEKSWHSQKTDKAEMENEFRVAKQQISKAEEEKERLREVISTLQKEIDDLQKERLDQEEELKAIREQRDEQERREIALTNRLNAAKKKEADKANLAEHFEDEMKALRDEAKESKQQVEDLTEAKVLLEEEVARLKASSEARVRQAELALADEKQLNEDRKGKMKVFIEKKSEELRQARADADSMQTELNQTSRSLMDLNNRWKQLHAQWVQSQTRNRELQRDLNRIKKDSENLHKVGDTLEMKLSRSANETEEHKNKRLAAKNELMTVLRTLEAEREVSARLRDAIKFTFTPKALSQQQLLKENLEEFENELMRLSRRFGKPLPPDSQGGLDASERSFSNGADEGITDDDGRAARSDGDIQKLIGKLDHETQGVSQYIMMLTGEIEKLHMLIDVSGSRNCYSTLSDIFLGATNSVAPAGEIRESVAESSVPLRAIRSHQYGQVPSNTAT
eukprot:scaffold2383_cov161-Amphora_coffeaeformis.AAC.32